MINGLISNEEMEDVHKISDCYVSFSSSEGVGMGAVEACMHDKPVIITDYGGASEYIKTPYLIDCGLQEIAEDDFLFKKGMIWGKPNFEQLMKYMSDAYNKKMKFMNHDYTKKMVGNDNILEEFFINVIGGKNNETD